MKSQKLQTISDSVFKRIFGQEKSIVIELINGFIKGEVPVIDIDFLPTELLPNRTVEKTKRGADASFNRTRKQKISVADHHEKAPQCLLMFLHDLAVTSPRMGA